VQRAFWQALLHYNVSFLMLSQAVKRLDRAVHVAERVYRSVLQKNSSSVKLLRIYTKFLEHVKHGEPGAHASHSLPSQMAWIHWLVAISV
jgi:hypothetical protein